MTEIKPLTKKIKDTAEAKNSRIQEVYARPQMR